VLHGLICRPRSRELGPRPVARPRLRGLRRQGRTTWSAPSGVAALAGHERRSSSTGSARFTSEEMDTIIYTGGGGQACRRFSTFLRLARRGACSQDTRSAVDPRACAQPDQTRRWTSFRVHRRRAHPGHRRCVSGGRGASDPIRQVSLYFTLGGIAHERTAGRSCSERGGTQTMRTAHRPRGRLLAGTRGWTGARGLLDFRSISSCRASPGKELPKVCCSGRDSRTPHARPHLAAIP